VKTEDIRQAKEQSKGLMNRLTVHYRIQDTNHPVCKYLHPIKEIINVLFNLVANLSFALGFNFPPLWIRSQNPAFLKQEELVCDFSENAYFGSIMICV